MGSGQSGPKSGGKTESSWRGETWLPAGRLELLFFTNMEKVKKRWRGTKISEKHQVTIPIDAMRIAGLEAGERVIARADGPGRVVLEREEDVLESFSGSMTGVFEHGILEQLRNEWE